MQIVEQAWFIRCSDTHTLRLTNAIRRGGDTVVSLMRANYEPLRIIFLVFANFRRLSFIPHS